MAEVIWTALQTQPPQGSHWSVRSTARHSGVSKITVQRWFDLFGLQPHRQRHFKISNDPFLIEKVHDVVGLYLNPPDHAVVLSVDERTQVQALQRTRPILPATHKHPKVRAWLAQRPRYHLHFTPTYAFWLNQVERWFGLITQQAIRGGSFSSTKALVRHIECFVQHYNANAALSSGPPPLIPSSPSSTRP